MPASPFWLDDPRYQSHRTTPDLPLRSNVVVIGGGITGVSAAYWLGRFGIETTLVERRGLSGGATGRNGGHIVSGPALEFGQAVGRYGAETARAIFQYTLDTIAAIQSFVEAHQIDCDLSLNGTVTLAQQESELAQLSESAAQFSKHGLPFEWWDTAACAERTRSSSFLGGLFNPNAGRLWPAKLAWGIAEQAVRLGVNVQAHTDVRAVVREGAQFVVNTDRGAILADVVVYATNAWTRELIPPLRDWIVPVRGQVIATQPAPPAWPFGLVTNFGYEYCTQRDDGRIVLGGMRWRSPTLEMHCDEDAALNREVSAGLREFLPAHFPTLRGIEVEYEWSGIMAFTPDLNPLVGPLPDRPGEYIAAGYSGHGMPIAFMAGKNVAEMIAGRRPERFVEAFLPERFICR